MGQEHIHREQREVSFLGEIREIVFGAQDGLISTLAVVATVAGATNDRADILIAGIATALAGVFSMAIGEYIGSKSQEEIFEERIKGEKQEVQDRPAEAEAEVAYMFMEEGMPGKRTPGRWRASSPATRNHSSPPWFQRSSAWRWSSPDGSPSPRCPLHGRSLCPGSFRSDLPVPGFRGALGPLGRSPRLARDPVLDRCGQEPLDQAVVAGMSGLEIVGLRRPRRWSRLLVRDHPPQLARRPAARSAGRGPASLPGRESVRCRA